MRNAIALLFGLATIVAVSCDLPGWLTLAGGILAAGAWASDSDGIGGDEK